MAINKTATSAVVDDAAVWQTETITAQDVILNTAGKYVDRDILIKSPGAANMPVDGTSYIPGAQQTITIGKGYSAGATYTIKPMSAGTHAAITGTDVDPGKTYTENTAVTIPSEGYLQISEGWIPNTKITLDQLLDGKEDTAGTAANHILNGYVAYNVDGKKLTGTIPTKTTASLTSVTDGAKVTVTVPAGYYEKDYSTSVSVKSMTLADTTLTNTAAEQSIVIPVGYNNTARTISTYCGAAALGASGTASAAINSLTVGVSNTSTGTVTITGSGIISGTANAMTTTTGRAIKGTTIGAGTVTGTANVNATLPLYTGSYTIG